MMNFYERVYEIVKEIPKGQVATYGQIAKILGSVKYSQVVGFALHKNPNPKEIPCHRVVNSQGMVSSAFAFGGANEQEKRLKQEGVAFIKEGQVDLKKCAWKEEIGVF